MALLPQAGSEAAESSRKKTVNATGGDTIAFREAQSGHWVQSIKSTENWRIISYRNIRLLSDVPGLDVPTKDDETTTVRDLLLQRLDVRGSAFLCRRSAAPALCVGNR
jgi:hypothetical protein